MTYDADGYRGKYKFRRCRLFLVLWQRCAVAALPDRMIKQKKSMHSSAAAVDRLYDSMSSPTDAAVIV